MKNTLFLAQPVPSAQHDNENGKIIVIINFLDRFTIRTCLKYS